MVNILPELIKHTSHCVKSVQIRSFFWSVFGHISHSVKVTYSNSFFINVLSDGVVLNPKLFADDIFLFSIVQNAIFLTMRLNNFLD